MGYFSESEWGKNGDKVTPFLKGCMESVRGAVGLPFYINPNGAYATAGHSEKSYHGKGMAVDGRFGPGKTPLQELDGILTVPGIRGVGFYPHWSPRAGWHLDTRPGPGKYWIEAGSKGKYTYFDDLEAFKLALSAYGGVEKSPAKADDFDRAFEEVLDVEGRSWSNVVGDRGKETYCGISRVAWPNIDLWPIIDGAKSQPDFPACLERNTVLQARVKAFYKVNFWDVLKCGQFDYALALELFDFAVNSGTKPAAMCLQRVLNVMNQGGTLWPDADPDGKIGDRETIPAVKAFVAKYGWEKLARFLNFMQASRFFEILERDPSQEKFAFGWLDKRC